MTPSRPLPADQLTYLRWLATAAAMGARRYHDQPPDGFDAKRATAARRALLKAGLVAYGTDDTGVHSRHTLELTDAGRQAVAISEEPL